MKGWNIASNVGVRKLPQALAMAAVLPVPDQKMTAISFMCRNLLVIHDTWGQPAYPCAH